MTSTLCLLSFLLFASQEACIYRPLQSFMAPLPPLLFFIYRVWFFLNFFHYIYIQGFTSRDLLVLGKIIITIIIIIIIEIIGLSGIQFGLLSYKWLIQSDDCEVGVGYINVNTKSCYQFIKTMTNLRKKLDVLVVHFHNKVCTWHMLSTHTGMMHQLFYYTVQTEAWHIHCPICA